MASSKKSASNKMLRMKLLVNSKTKSVLYGEAGKDVVDFLFSLLTLPVGTVVKLLSTNTMVGSVGNLYRSVEKLDDTFIIGGDAKDALLTPGAGCASGKMLKLPETVTETETEEEDEEDEDEEVKEEEEEDDDEEEMESESDMETAVLYRCNNMSSKCRNYVTKVRNTACPNCRHPMSAQMQPLVEPDGGSVRKAVPWAAKSGFVQGIVTYTVMDDLTVTPMSNISGISLLNTFGIFDIRSLQEKTVQLGYAEGLEILKASLQSRTVLTDVFLGKKRKA